MSEMASPSIGRPLALSQPAPDKRAVTKAAPITSKVRDALHAMVWDGLPRKDAAAKVGITEHGLYKALRKANVKQHYLSELEVLRTSERARNIHTLAEVRDQTTNQMARVNAVKALEQISDVETAAATQQRSPGVVVVVMSSHAHAPQAPNPVHVIENVEDGQS